MLQALVLFTFLVPHPDKGSPGPIMHEATLEGPHKCSCCITMPDNDFATVVIGEQERIFADSALTIPFRLTCHSNTVSPSSWLSSCNNMHACCGGQVHC